MEWEQTVADTRIHGTTQKQVGKCFEEATTAVAIDSDADRILDCEDACPNDPEKTEPGVCGCGEPEIDTDQDGALDCEDGCPEHPDKVEAGACGCGLPDEDNDGNGIPDCAEPDSSIVLEFRFDADNEGWTVSNNDSREAYWTIGGKDGGGVSQSFAIKRLIAYWRAPAESLGDLSEAIGGTLMFETHSNHDSTRTRKITARTIQAPGGGLES